ncbi:MAG: hypothetical protein AAGL49_09485, partial [Pseudomonadota bacterium]
MSGEVRSGRIAGVIVGAGSTSVFSLSGRARLARTLQRIGVPVVDSLEAAAEGDDVLIVNADFAIEERALVEFAGFRRAALAAESEAGQAVVAAAICPAAMAAEIIGAVQATAPAADLPPDTLSIFSVDEVAGTYNERLRKRERAVVRQ